MLPTIKAVGVPQAFRLLRDIAGRAGDASPAWDAVADDVFAFQRKFWLMAYGGVADKDQRAGRNPRHMVESGGLHASATRRGASRQRVKINGSYLLIEVTHGLGVLHEARGREVLGTPGAREAGKYAEKVAGFILTGSV